MPSHLLALDVGTTTVKALLLSLSDASVVHAQNRLTSKYPAQDRVEQDPEQVWETTFSTIKQALKAAKLQPSDIASIGITTQRSSIVVWDKTTGASLAPMVIWSDNRGRQRARELRAKGYLISDQQAASKLESVIASLSQTPEKLLWGNIDSFIIWQLSAGAFHVTDKSQAWASGYLDYAEGKWNERLIKDQNLSPDIFPTLVDTRGNLAATARNIFGAKVPISAIIADQQSALVAHNCLLEGKGKITLGTASVFNMCTGSTPLMLSETLIPWIQDSVGKQVTYCLEGMVLSGGAMLEWLVGSLEMAANAQSIEGRVEKISSSEGVCVLPALWGLGAPHGKSDATATICGLTVKSTKAHILRAALEGIAFRIREIVEAIEGAAPFPQMETIPVDGGMTAIPSFMSILANVLQRPIQKHAIQEATAYGAALSAGLGSGLLTTASLPQYIQYSQTFSPEQEAGEWDSKFSIWKEAVYAGSKK